MSEEVLILRMITSEDLKRLMGDKLETENRINTVSYTHLTLPTKRIV